MSDLFANQHSAKAPKQAPLAVALFGHLESYLKPGTQKAGQIYGEIDACHMGDRAAAALHSLGASRDWGLGVWILSRVHSLYADSDRVAEQG